MFKFIQELFDSLFKTKKRKPTVPYVVPLPPPVPVSVPTPAENVARETLDLDRSKLSNLYKSRLLSCHPDLQQIVLAVVEAAPFKICVVEGYRNKETQQLYVKKGTSKVNYPRSYHNATVGMVKKEHRPNKDAKSECSLAVDLAPLSEDGRSILWKDAAKFKQIADLMKAEAQKRNIHVDWGYDMWKWDAPHFQLTLHRK